jgi:hypothetical protein
MKFSHKVRLLIYTQNYSMNSCELFPSIELNNVLPDQLGIKFPSSIFLM